MQENEEKWRQSFCLNGLMTLFNKATVPLWCECVLSTLHYSPSWLSPARIISLALLKLRCRVAACRYMPCTHGVKVVNVRVGFLIRTLKKPMPTVRKWIWSAVDSVIPFYCVCLRKMFPNWRGRCTLICGAFCVDTNHAFCFPSLCVPAMRIAFHRAMTGSVIPPVHEVCGSQMLQHGNEVPLLCQDKIPSIEYHKLIPGGQT